MATDPNSLLAQGGCYACFSGNQFTVNLMMLALLKQIAVASGSTMATDAQSLITQAACYECFAGNQYMTNLMMLALLAQISNNGGTGGSGGGIFSGTGWPVGVVTPSGSAALYIQTDSTPPGLLWEWYSGSWH